MIYDNVIYKIICIIAVLGGCIGTIIYFGKFCNWVKKLFSIKYRQQKEIYLLIKEWYDYIHINLDTENFNIAALDKIEKDIDFLFNKNHNFSLIFTKKFIKKSFKILGVERNTKDIITQFIKYVGLDCENNLLAFTLYEKSKNKTYKFSNYPYRFYWQFIMGRFYVFHSQYKKTGKILR